MMTPAFLLALLVCPQEADVVIRGATVVDGTGAEGRVADVAIRGDAIVAVGAWEGGATRTIPGKGLVVAPGFIDLHSHSDSGIVAPATRDNLNYVTQGCTTVVTGNCGGGQVDAAKLLDAVDRDGAGTNVIHLIPHGAVRRRVFGTVDRAPTPDELAEMKAVVERGMKAGAWGMSTGLIYTPGTFAETGELVELAKVVHGHGGIYASHIRSEAGGLLDAIREAIAVGERSGCPVHISHFKCSTKVAWGKMAEACALVEEARGRGRRVTVDQYPYTASSTSLTAFVIPAWAREGGRRELIRRLDDPEQAARIRRAVAASFERRDGADKIMIARFRKDPSYNGRNLLEIARAEEKDPVDVVIAIERAGGAQGIGFSMKPDDMFLAMGKPWLATASDGSAKKPSNARPHPRNYGTFPRKIGRFAIEEKRFSLAFAVRSATGLPAEILGLRDRGTLRAGHRADVVVFDPGTFRDRATFEDPDTYSTGVRWLFVNGTAVIAEGKPTGALPGRSIRLNR